MKHLFIILSTLCLCASAKITLADTQKVDSIVNELADIKLDAVDQLLFNTFAEQELKLTPSQVQALSAKQRGNFFSRFINWIGEFFEPIWGKYREPGRRTQGPYMVFQYKQFSDLQIKVDTIRNRIKNKAYGYDKLYYDIYSYAISNQTANNTNKNEVAANANVAKCAAFVYIIGLDWVDYDTSNTFTAVDYFSDFSATSIIDRNYYATKAENILLNVDVPGLNNNLDGISNIGPVFSQIANALNGLSFLDLIHRSRELLSYLAAYDMLKWRHNIDPNLPESSDAYNINLIAYRLKREMVVPIYKRCIGLMFPVNHNNHSLMAAAALGSAAIVLGEYGGYCLNDWDSWPNRWANLANYQIHNVMWRDPVFKVPMQYPAGKLSEPGGTQGFAEGDHYFKITMENLLPYMIAQYNYQQGVHTRPYRNYPLIGLNIFPSPHAMYMKTMLKDPDYDNMFKWYRNITMPNGKTACIDESWNNGNSSGILGIKNSTVDGEYLQTFSSGSMDSLGLKLGVLLVPDYIAALPKIDRWSNFKSVQMRDGTTVLRNVQKLPNNESASHFLLALAENDVADNSAWHEQSDVGQITLTVDSNNLLIDPAKWNGQDDDVNLGLPTFPGKSILEEMASLASMSLKLAFPGLFSNHNIIYHSSFVNAKNHFITKITPYNESFRIVMEESTYNDTRQIELVKGLGYWYYVVNDRSTDVEGGFTKLKFNGNSETSFTQNGGKAQWNFSCLAGPKRWGLIIESAGTSASVTYDSELNKHGSFEPSFIETNNAVSGGGFHRTFIIKTENKNDVHFISKLTPYRCDMSNLVNTTITNNDDYAMLYVRIGRNSSTDSIRNYHIASRPGADSVYFNRITLIGQSGYVSWDDDSVFKNGYCLSFTGFRRGVVNQSKSIKYQNIEIVRAHKWVDAYYELISKYKYQGYIKSDTANQVTLYIGDLDLNYLMVAKDKLGNSLPSIHNSTDPNSYKYITFNVPMGLTEFTLELADPCLVSCFFPPTVMTIDTFFDFYQGSTETLGHNLDIVKDSGELHIRDGSKMSICPNYYLFNRDSITMRSDEANPLEMFPLYAAEEDLPGGGTGITNPAYLQRLASKRSMIIVNDRAALILDSGSFTHVGIGATILIRKGGTLYVKKGATLEIGSQAMNGYGELIAESGSYICIEDSSDLHFFVTSPDTNNTNIFFVPSGVNETVNLNGIQSQFKTGGRFAGAVNCLPLCSLWYYLEDYGVNNPDFGTNSLGRPISRFTLQSDTLCGEIDSIIYIDASKSLNEVKYRITATRPGLPDSVYFRKQEGSYGMLTNHEPVNISSLGFGTGTIKIELAVENTCGDTDYMVKNVYIPVGPTVNFTLSSDTICPGYGTLLIDGSASTSGQATIKHEWTVILIDTNSYSVGDTNQVMYGNVWQFDSSAVRSQFNFPGFRWIGGFNYLVGLKVYGNCDMVAERWDTVSVPFQVFVTSNGLHTTNGNIGSEVNLVGFITTAYDSFVWYPSNLVSDPDTLRPYSTTNQDSTLYTLTAYSGSCQAVDSIWIKHTEFVNLGVDTVVCIGSDVVIGNKLEASLLIGIMAYTDHATYSSAISILESSVPDANIKLGLFLYDNNYANFNSLKTTSSALTDLITKYGYNFYSNNSYYEVLDYYKTHSLSQTLDFFRGDYWPNHPELTSIIDNQISLYGGNSNFIAQTQGEVLNMLDQFKSNSGGISTNTIWYKNNNQVTTENDWMMLHDVINEPTKFTMVISSSSVVEYDDIMIYVDSILHPFFSLGTFTDSVTLQFINYTNANTFNNTTSYKWYFGDGDSSSLVNPIHSYAVKDSNYVVCLKASNTCGTYMYCDTLPLGSITINGFGKKSNSDSPNSWKEPSTVKQTLDKIDNRNYLGNNRPNPFRGTTDIDFEVKPETNEARIRIVNQLGQLMKDTKLYAVKGTITIDAEGWQAGLYHCNLVVDGIVVESRLMIIK